MLSNQRPRGGPCIDARRPRPYNSELGPFSMGSRVEAVVNLGASELILILIIALVLFGPGKLPEIGRALGRGIRDFKDAINPDSSGNK